MFICFFFFILYSYFLNDTTIFFIHFSLLFDLNKRYSFNKYTKIKEKEDEKTLKIFYTHINICAFS